MAYRDYANNNGFIVALDGTGDFTSIQSAITAAPSGTIIYIKPGTYTENITMKDGVDLACFAGAAYSFNTRIHGKVSYSGSAMCSLSGICLETNGDYIIEFTGINAGNLNLINCYFELTNFSAIHYTNSNANSFLDIFSCESETYATGIALYVMTSPGELNIQKCFFYNDGLSVTVSTQTAGLIRFSNSFCEFPLSNSGTTTLLGVINSTIDCTTINTTAVNIASTNVLGFNVSQSQFASGTSSCIVAGAGSVLLIAQTETSCTSGAGVYNISSPSTVNLGIITCTGTNITFNLTGTVNKLTTFGGLVDVSSGSWTPTITGGSTAGTTTYTTQFGNYTKIDNMVFCNGFVQYSAATGTGAIVLGGLPFTIANTSNYYPQATTHTTGALTFPAGTTYLNIQGVAGTTTANIIACGSGTAGMAVSLTNISNGFNFSLAYSV